MITQICAVGLACERAGQPAAKIHKGCWGAVTKVVKEYQLFGTVFIRKDSVGDCECECHTTRGGNATED